MLLVPAIIMSLKSLKASPVETIKKILQKSLRALASLTFLCCVPAVTICHAHRFFGGANKLCSLFCFAIGALGLIIEKPIKNVQLMSFFAPKAIEILFNLIKEKGLMRGMKWH